MIHRHRPGRGGALLAGALLAVLVASCSLRGGGPADEGIQLPDAGEDPSSAQGSDGSLPADVSSDYAIGPDDLLDVRVFAASDLSGEVRVTSGGRISMPLLGPIEAEGLTARELEETVEDLLRDTYMWDPQVSVQVLEARSHVVSRVYVLGDVRRPGGFPLERGEPISVVQAIALAEGLERTAAKGRAKIIRGGASSNNGPQEEVPVDLGRILDGRASDLDLRHSDILYVPNSRPRSALRGVWEGFLRIFTLRGILY